MSKTTITITAVPEDLAGWLSHWAAQNGNSRSELLRRLLHVYAAYMHYDITGKELPGLLNELHATTVSLPDSSFLDVPTSTTSTCDGDSECQSGTPTVTKKGQPWSEEEKALLGRYKDKWRDGQWPRPLPGYMGSLRAAMKAEEDGGIGLTWEEAEWVIDNLDQDRQFADSIRRGYVPPWPQIWSLGKDRHGNIAATSAAPNLIRMLELRGEPGKSKAVGWQRRERVDVDSRSIEEWYEVYFDDGDIEVVNTEEEAKALCE